MNALGSSRLAGLLALILVLALSSSRLTAAFPQTRTISLHNIHTKETITVQYKKDGKYVPDALDQINWVMRDWRKDEKTRMDPELIDLLWEMHTELGSREPIHLISGYRSHATNDMLRSTVGGQASQSRHILGKAADVQFPDVPVRRLRYSALIRERGGVGYYPTSAIPFVHVDTDRVRAWPRLPRQELALLFPDGRTQHVPADGQPLTPADAREARAAPHEQAADAASVVQRHKLATGPTPITVADAGAAPRSALAPEHRMTLARPPAPQESRPAPPVAAPRLVTEPKLAERPARGPSADERLKLAQLASLASLPGLSSRPLASSATVEREASAVPARLVEEDTTARLGAGEHQAAIRDRHMPQDREGGAITGRFNWGARSGALSVADTGSAWAVAPPYDEEHPEELSYRPFPVAPYLTQTASADDPALARMEHPDVAKTLELMEQAGEMPPMSLRPGPQTARILWAQQFQGEAVALARVFSEPPPAPGGIAGRAVRLTAR